MQPDDRDLSRTIFCSGLFAEWCRTSLIVFWVSLHDKVFSIRAAIYILFVGFRTRFATAFLSSIYLLWFFDICQCSIEGACCNFASLRRPYVVWCDTFNFTFNCISVKHAVALACVQVEFLDGCLYCVAVAAGHGGSTISPLILRRTYLVFWKLSISKWSRACAWLVESYVA